MGKFFAIVFRFVLGAGLVAVFGYLAYLALDGFLPTAGPGNFPLGAPLGALACAAAVGYGVALALSRTPWRRILWATRAFLLALIVMGFAYWKTASWLEGGVLAGLLVVGLTLHHVAHRHALGWIIDENGERQKVDHWIRGRAVFNATTRDQRLIAEAFQKSARRKTLAWTLLLAVPISYGAYRVYNPKDWIATIVVGFFAGMLLLFGVLPSLIGELLYQIGYQDMNGAKVLDPEVHRPGISEIVEQMAHGSASVANEAEAQGYLNRKK